MFFFAAFLFVCITITPLHAENIYGGHSMYSFDVPGQPVCTGVADVYYYSPCSNYYPSLGPDHPSTYCVYEYVACCCAHCMECIDPSDTSEPTQDPTTLQPTEATLEPTEATLEPTEATLEPTETTLEPTDATLEPTAATPEPTSTTSEPTSDTPSKSPSVLPSQTPTFFPTTVPSSTPSVFPSSFPSVQPSSTPSMFPSSTPSFQPSSQPSSTPSIQPSSTPSGTPSVTPGTLPSSIPSSTPSLQPSSQPNSSPSSTPSFQPSSQPSSTPSIQPSSTPSDTPSVATLVPTTQAPTYNEISLLVVSTEAAALPSPTAESQLSVSVEILLGFVFVSLWVLCCGGFWLYYKSTRKTASPKKVVSDGTRERTISEVMEACVQKIRISVPMECEVAEPAETVINMSELAVEGTGTAVTPGQCVTPGEGYDETARHRDATAPPSPFLSASLERPRTHTVATDASMGSLHDSYFADEEDDTSMDLYEDTFAKIDIEGIASTGSGANPRMSEGGVVTGFDAQRMMRDNVVDKVFDEFDASYDVAFQKKQHQFVHHAPGGFHHDVQEGPAFSPVNRNHATAITLAGADSDMGCLESEDEFNVYSY